MVPATIFDTALPALDLVLWACLAVALFIFCLFSAILLWHWKLYSTSKFTTVASMLVYLGVGFGLLILMALSAAWYSLA